VTARALLLCLTLAFQLRAATLTLHWPEKRYADEQMTIVVKLDDPWMFPKDVQIDNFDLVRADHCDSDRGGEDTLCIVGYAREAGDIVIHPMVYTDHQQHERHTEEVRMPVAASPAMGSSVGAALEALRTAGLTASVIVPEIKKPSAFAGEVVRVEYWVWGQADDVFYRPPSTAMETLKNARWSEYRQKELATLDGTAVWKTRIATLQFEAPDSGVINVPPIAFLAEDARRTNRMRTGTSERAEFRRIGGGLQIAVVAPPVKDMAFGALRVECDRRGMMGGWPIFSMTIRGDGSLRSSRRPHFKTRPPMAALINTSGPRFEETVMTQHWDFAVHARKAGTLPDLLFDYYDTERGAVAQLQCQGAAYSGLRFKKVRETPQPSRTPAEPPFMGMIEAIAALMAAIAGTVFVHLKMNAR